MATRLEPVAPVHEAQEAQDCRAEQDVERVGAGAARWELATCPAEWDGSHGVVGTARTAGGNATRERSPSRYALTAP
jgi:hypothetical protein